MTVINSYVMTVTNCYVIVEKYGVCYLKQCNLIGQPLDPIKHISSASGYFSLLPYVISCDVM